MNSGSSLVLGTVQFGLRYGIANTVGQPDAQCVSDIVRAAWESGIREFDTAQDYGVSEDVLGKAFIANRIENEASVISKIDPEIDHCNAKVMGQALKASLERLCVPCLHGLMLHNEKLLTLWGRGLGDILKGFQASGKVKYLGVSVYSPEKALEGIGMGLDMVQVPTNILDRRFTEKGVFEHAGKKSCKVYVRSVFLQGLILMKPEEVPAHLSFAKPVLEKVQSLCDGFKLSRQALALGYVKAGFPGAKVLLGVDTISQLEDNVKDWNQSIPSELVTAVERTFSGLDENLLNPSLWRR